MTTAPIQQPQDRQRPKIVKRENQAEIRSTEAALEKGVRITLDGETYELRMGDVTSTLARELRAKSGMSFYRMMELVAEEPDVDVVASFVWCARRARGDQVAFDDVELSYRQLLSDGFDIALAGEEEVGDGPEA